MLSFAGLYELWPDPSKAEDDPDRWLWTATIITTEATGAAGEIHDRTPLILPTDRIDAWLNPALTDPAEATKLLSGITIDPLEVRAVSTQVNKVSINKPELIQPLDDHGDEPLHLELTSAG